MRRIIALLCRSASGILALESENTTVYFRRKAGRLSRDAAVCDGFSMASAEFLNG
jgi:hypothetical protein